MCCTGQRRVSGGGNPRGDQWARCGVHADEHEGVRENRRVAGASGGVRGVDDGAGGRAGQRIQVFQVGEGAVELEHDAGGMAVLRAGAGRHQLRPVLQAGQGAGQAAGGVGGAAVCDGGDWAGRGAWRAGGGGGRCGRGAGGVHRAVESSPAGHDGQGGGVRAASGGTWRDTAACCRRGGNRGRERDAC